MTDNFYMTKAMTKLSLLVLGMLLTAVGKAEERLVSTSGAISEIIVLLGKADELVGVDTTSMRPPEVMANIEKIGYRRNLSAEGVLSLNPSLVFLAPDSGPQEVIEQLQSAGLNTVMVEDKQTKASVETAIRQVATLLNVAEKGEAVIAEINSKAQQLEASIASYPKQPTTVFLLDTGGSGMVALGRDSAGNHMLDIVGATNVFADDFKQFKTVSTESILSQDPDVIFIAKRTTGLTDGGVISDGERYQFLAPSRAMQNGCVFEVDLTSTLGFGPSYVDGAQQLADFINQCLADK